MAWKSGKSEAPEQCPEGPRVLAYVAGSGRVVRGDYQGNISPRFRLEFECEPGKPPVTKPDGTPFRLRKFIGASIQERSHVGILIVTSRGHALRESEMGTMDEAPAPGVEEPLPPEVEQLLVGLRVMTMVTHNAKGWAEFNPEACTKAPEQAKDEGW